ncbi:hypothetical protein M8756_05055 [Lutimaribacter sp. EGI FJ00015]|uniref:Uncharacterized protein n=1 Tax=Lutimaribacter degradans TaxID=2945989 RepID=A0ACC5ZTE0_9RHOB|nr:hypothetical protein [Lutimaribacter sp. EGI FJ00013]MCM2561623.1 hypothetical protein [Lutimaribacter sp. EGI FJ00013]MCO0612666.1 hypothetical protein [Lutimaribacter sp. EGI FJ00015]MCO0635324.1 hypothetical protein [Lutimaribacter sp. EGI FJ00014]
MTRQSPPAPMRHMPNGPDRAEIVSLLHDSLVPDLLALETLLDRIEHRESRA